jgi:hypothetical protein
VPEDAPEVLAREAALAIVATRHPGVFVRHPVEPVPVMKGEPRLNPLYVAEPEGDRVRLRLRFPSAHYEEELGAARREYLPEAVIVDRRLLAALGAGEFAGELIDLARQRVILDLPRKYY